jgi:hypothetical protein
LDTTNSISLEVTTIEALTKFSKQMTINTHLPSCKSSEKTAVLFTFSLSQKLKPENGPEENIEEVQSDS